MTSLALLLSGFAIGCAFAVIMIDR